MEMSISHFLDKIRLFFCILKNSDYICNPKREQGLVVQLVRIHACHAWGRGFESRPDRKTPEIERFRSFRFYILSNTESCI